MNFDIEEVERRTARRTGLALTRVRELMDAYTDEYVRHARETDPSLIMPAKPAKSRRTNQKATAGVTGQENADGGSQG